VENFNRQILNQGLPVADKNALDEGENVLPSSMRRQLLKFLALGVAVCSVPACRGERKLGPGDRFPDVSLPDLQGSVVPFSVYSNVALVVNFWATWCEPCRREMPDLEKLGSLFRPGDLRVIGITVDKDINLAREFSFKYKLTFPLLSDASQALSNSILQISGFPATYLLRRDHSIASIIVGAREWAGPKMVGEIERLLDVSRMPAV
jgi:peroxiredoxin